MSFQAVDWAKHHAPMLLTDKGKPDTTAREILGELAEHADERGRGAYPSVTHVRWATGYDERTIQRALLRLERAGLIARAGTSRDGCVRWDLDMSRVRPESDWTVLEAAVERARRVESERRAARRNKSKTVDTSGTQNPGHSDAGESNQGDVRDAESRRPGRKIPASGTQNPGVRDATPPEPSENHQRTIRGTSPGGTLPPDPRRPHDPPSSGHGNEPANSIPPHEAQPPQPETATHDRAREEDRDPAPDPATAEESPPEHTAASTSAPARCAQGHGLKGGTRPDGQPNCPICRRLARTTGADPPADPPAPASPPGPAAGVVIPFPTRTA